MSPEAIASIVLGLMKYILELVTHEQAKDLLDQAAVDRANAIADAAEAIKFSER